MDESDPKKKKSTRVTLILNSIAAQHKLVPSNTAEKEMTYAAWIWVLALLMINATVKWKWSCAQAPLATQYSEKCGLCAL